MSSSSTYTPEQLAAIEEYKKLQQKQEDEELQNSLNDILDNFGELAANPDELINSDLFEVYKKVLFYVDNHSKHNSDNKRLENSELLVLYVSRLKKVYSKLMRLLKKVNQNIENEKHSFRDLTSLMHYEKIFYELLYATINVVNGSLIQDNLSETFNSFRLDNVTDKVDALEEKIRINPKKKEQFSERLAKLKEKQGKLERKQRKLSNKRVKKHYRKLKFLWSAARVQAKFAAEVVYDYEDRLQEFSDRTDEIEAKHNSNWIFSVRYFLRHGLQNPISFKIPVINKDVEWKLRLNPTERRLEKKLGKFSGKVADNKKIRGKNAECILVFYKGLEDTFELGSTGRGGRT